MSSTSPHRCHRPDLDLEECLITSPLNLTSSSLSADDIAADVEPNYAHDDDRQAASTSQPLAPSVISSVSSTNQNQTNIVSPPPLAGMGNNEIAPNNDGQQSSLDIDGVDNPPPLLRTAAKCKDLEFGNIDVDDSDPMKSSANSSDDVIVVPSRGENDREAMVSSRQGAVEVDEEDAVQNLAVNFVSTAADATGNNDADFRSVPDVASIAFDVNAARIDHGPQDLIIHDAFLVEMTEDDVIVATHIEPTLPWWKQKRIQLLLSTLFLFVVTNAVAIVLLCSGNDGNNEPSTAPAPTPSSADLSSLNSHPPSVPTYFLTPKECADRVAANAQKVEIGLDDPRHPIVAVDGSNMVMAVSDGETTRSQFVKFYAFATTGTWQEVQSFRMKNVGSGDASIALSGKTALVGFGEANNFAGVVLVYEQNQLGSWEQVNDPFIRTALDESRYGFGLHQVAIDGDFACVIDYNNCVHGYGPNKCNHNVNVFRRVGKRWGEFDVIAGENCRIAGNILAVLDLEKFSDSTWNLRLFEVNETVDSFVPYQDPIIVYEEVSSMELRRNRFVYWDRSQQSVVIYQRQTESEPYSLIDQIFVSALSENRIAIHNDVLVVGGDNQTHIFSDDSDNWIETIALDQRYGHHEYYQLSNRTLLVTGKSNVYSYNIEECTQEMLTQSPSSSSPPSLKSSLSSPPTDSLVIASSSSPTACVDKLLSSAQRIETSLDNPKFITMEVDGKTMVLVVQDGDGSIFVIFYMWATNDGWQLDRGFDLSDLSVEGGAAAAISGNAAFVGFPGKYTASESGTVVIFHRYQTGTWEKGNPLTLHGPAPGSRYGYGVGIDGNLAIVATNFFAGFDKIIIYRQENNKWAQLDKFNGRCPCSISGDVIVSMKADAWYNQVVQLFKYTADAGAFVPIQDPIPSENVIQIDSSNDYFLYWDAAASWIDAPSSTEIRSNTLMYWREDGNQTFTFLRQFNISGENELSIHNDILVISGQVFSLQNGNWVESFTLGRRFDEYKLSDRLLLARTEKNFISFNIAECTQEMPTQVPSLSVSPSIIPSISPPTIVPSLSDAPSLSSSPTINPSTSLAPSFTSYPTDTCYWVVISIEYDDFSSEVSWKLYRINDSNDRSEEVVQSFATTEYLQMYLDSICLPDGSYKFIIFDSAHDGICCKFDEASFYSLSLEDGVLIREGGEFESSESTVFSIPFVLRE